MDPQTNSEEEYRIQCLEKALNLYGQYVTSAGLKLEIPPDEIGPRFLGAVDNDEEWVVFKAHYEQMINDGRTLEVRMGDVQYFFERTLNDEKEP